MYNFLQTPTSIQYDLSKKKKIKALRTFTSEVGMSICMVSIINNCRLLECGNRWLEVFYYDNLSVYYFKWVIIK